MGASMKACLYAAAGCGIAVSGIFWYFELNWSFSTFLLIWGAATLIAWPGVLQDMANEKIVDGDPPPPPEPEMRPGYWPEPKQENPPPADKPAWSAYIDKLKPTDRNEQPGGEDIERGFHL